ncbi:DUF4625 domain-containing protein [Carboxylicivirga sp. M1479]|uniref:DUF4625 domain-containing protein n=1 Tax=Carboxylicivirga sp. M1479 TaxID=2594476 RepID=UPI00117798A9|nr:DUF4625 domain-containing protein [Carboxylicivirga sp. M1479]TRX71803.1 DUF4625 domain-containing protein [Carboxylicivirga sp. M1479]
MKNKYLIVCLFLMPIWLACQKDEVEDTTPPVARVELPTNNTMYYRGNTLMFTGYFTDDVELKECTFYLSQGLKAARGWDEVWEPDAQTFPLSGLEDELIEQYLFELMIPNEIKSGDYVLKVLTVDKALNYSTTEIPIQIK